MRGDLVVEAEDELDGKVTGAAAVVIAGQAGRDAAGPARWYGSSPGGRPPPSVQRALRCGQATTADRLESRTGISDCPIREWPDRLMTCGCSDAAMAQLPRSGYPSGSLADAELLRLVAALPPERLRALADRARPGSEPDSRRWGGSIRRPDRPVATAIRTARQQARIGQKQRAAGVQQDAVSQGEQAAPSRPGCTWPRSCACCRGWPICSTSRAPRRHVGSQLGRGRADLSRCTPIRAAPIG